MLKTAHKKMTGIRIGQGFDVHRFGEGDHLILGGVKIPYSQGMVAHSDGDVLLHAICDALLGAIAAGDIGHHFPDTDEKWRGANSRDLLKECYRLVQDAGFQLANVDACIIAQSPKMAPHIIEMRANIASDLGVIIEQVNVKATTTEKLGFTGRGEGIAVQASLLIQPISPLKQDTY